MKAMPDANVANAAAATAPTLSRRRLHNATVSSQRPRPSPADKAMKARRINTGVPNTPATTNPENTLTAQTTFK